MTDAFELTSTYVIASDNTATVVEGGEAFWRGLAERDPHVQAADGGSLVSSYQLAQHWPNWEMHPNGDEIVHSRGGRCELILETNGGTDSVLMTSGRTVVIPRGTWHTVRVHEPAELLHITYGSGTTFKPADAEPQ